MTAAVSKGQTTSQALTEVENRRPFEAKSQSTASHLFARTRSFHHSTFIHPGLNPVPEFLRLPFRNCKSCVYKSDDLLSHKKYLYSKSSNNGKKKTKTKKKNGYRKISVYEMISSKKALRFTVSVPRVERVNYPH